MGPSESVMCHIAWTLIPPLSVLNPQSLCLSVIYQMLPWCLNGKESFWQCRRYGLHPWVGKIPWRRRWQPTPEFFPGKAHGRRSLAGYRVWGCKRVRHNLATKQQQQQSKYLIDELWSKPTIPLLLLLLSRVWLCATPQTAAHQAPPSLAFSRQEHWSGLPFPSPLHESEKWKWSRSVVSDL